MINSLERAQVKIPFNSRGLSYAPPPPHHSLHPSHASLMSSYNNNMMMLPFPNLLHQQPLPFNQGLPFHYFPQYMYASLPPPGFHLPGRGNEIMSSYQNHYSPPQHSGLHYNPLPSVNNALPVLPVVDSNLNLHEVDKIERKKKDEQEGNEERKRKE